MFNAAKEKQQQLQQQHNSERDARLAASGNVLYEDYIIVKINGGEAIITGYKRMDYNQLPEHVILPDRVNGKKVTKIGKNAFVDYPKRITYLVLPKYLKSIADNAFHNCDISTIELPVAENTSQAKNNYMSGIQCALTAFTLRYNMRGLSRIKNRTNINRYFTLKDALSATYVSTTNRDED